MKTKQAYLEYLESLSDHALPCTLLSLSESQLAGIKDYVDDVLAREQAGLDRLFESMSPTMKYIPNFLLVALTKKFIDPPIAARITEKLQLKQAVAVASGLSEAYVAEVALYLQPALAGELLDAFPKTFARHVVAQIGALQPLRWLDIVAVANDSFLKRVAHPSVMGDLDDTTLNAHRRDAFERWQGWLG